MLFLPYARAVPRRVVVACHCLLIAVVTLCLILAPVSPSW